MEIALVDWEKKDLMSMHSGVSVAIFVYNLA